MKIIKNRQQQSQKRLKSFNKKYLKKINRIKQNFKQMVCYVDGSSLQKQMYLIKKASQRKQSFYHKTRLQFHLKQNMLKNGCRNIFTSNNWDIFDYKDFY